MYQNGIGEYLDSEYSAHPAFLEEAIYAKLLDSIVIACVDILALSEEGTVVIAKRVRHPQADWWIFGGRMIAGENIVSTAHRIMKKECGLDISPIRFTPFTCFVAAWPKRAHEPIKNGTHTISITVMVKLTQAEVGAIVLNDEYSELKLVKMNEIAKSTKYHPALRQCVQELSKL